MTVGFETFVVHGWAIFPVRGKIPATRHGFKDAVKDPDAAMQLFKAHPGCGVAIATGTPSGGLLVLDIDDRKGGDDSLVLLEEELGERLPTSVRALTPGGGQHIYLQLPGGIQVASAVDFRPGIDIRSEGGYVVCPPSTGYQWEDSCRPDINNPAAIPGPLLARLLERAKSNGVHAGESGWDSGGFLLPNIIGQGARDITLTRFAGQLRRGGLDAESILDMLQHVNESRCRPMLANRDLKRIARSIGGKPTIPLVLPGAMQLSQLLDGVLEESARPKMFTEFPLLDRRIRGFRARTSTAIIAGTGQGKTSFALQVATHHAKSNPTIYCGLEMTQAQLAARVISQRTGRAWHEVLDGEVSLADMQRAVDGLHLYFTERKADPYASIQAALERAARETNGTPLVIVDYVQLLASVGADMRMATIGAIRKLLAMVETTDVVLWFLSQGSRASAKAMREQDGKSAEDYIAMGAETAAIEASAVNQLVFTYRKDDDSHLHDVAVQVAKARYGTAGTVGFRFDGRTGLWSELDRPPMNERRQARRDSIITSLQAASGPLSKNRIRERDGRTWVRGDKRDVLREIDSMLEDGELKSAQGGVWVAE